MTGKLVSIIITVFNREEIVGKTIESVLRQTYKNLEIIIVDDGSTDKSYFKCSEYAENDSRIILIKKENRGVSSARNASLDIMRGEYVFFLDSDDFLYGDTIEKLVSCAENFLCDIVQGYKFERYCGIRKMQYLEYFMSDIYIPVVWGKLYRSDIVKNTRFDETLMISEDADYLFELINRANDIVCCDGDFIATTPTETGLNRKEYGENLLLLIKVLEKVLKRLCEIQDEEFAKYIYRNYACALFTNYIKAKRYRIDNYLGIRKTIQKKYRRMFIQILKANSGDWKSKLACVLGWISLDIYKIKV